MFIKHLIAALLTSLLLTAIFFIGFRKRGPWNSFILFFFVIGLSSWAGGIWLSPMGPLLWGVYWIGFLVTGIVVALILVAVIPPVSSDTTAELIAKDEREPEAKKRIVLGVYFWLMIAVLAFFIVSHYF